MANEIPDIVKYIVRGTLPLDGTRQSASPSDGRTTRSVCVLLSEQKGHIDAAISRMVYRSISGEKIEPIVVERMNSGIENLQIASSSYSYTYCQIPIDDYSIEHTMNNAELIHSLKAYGCDPGGILKGKFIWARGSGPEVALLSVGSRDYELAAEYTRKLKMKRVAKKDLVFGREYETPAGKKMVYLGKTYTNKISVVRWGNYYNRRPDPGNLTLVHVAPSTEMLLWYENKSDQQFGASEYVFPGDKHGYNVSTPAGTTSFTIGGPDTIYMQYGGIKQFPEAVSNEIIMQLMDRNHGSPRNILSDISGLQEVVNMTHVSVPKYLNPMIRDYIGGLTSNDIPVEVTFL